MAGLALPALPATGRSLTCSQGFLPSGVSWFRRSSRADRPPGRTVRAAGCGVDGGLSRRVSLALTWGDVNGRGECAGGGEEGSAHCSNTAMSSLWISDPRAARIGEGAARRSGVSAATLAGAIGGVAVECIHGGGWLIAAKSAGSALSPSELGGTNPGGAGE